MSAGRSAVPPGLLLALLLIVTTGCVSKDPAARQPRLVILYATCSLNRDMLSPYNDAVSFTPNIDRFARQSVVFHKHTTEAGESGPAYASIFSGTQADRHGVYVHPAALPDDLYLIAEAFSDAGFKAFFWNAHVMASPRLNYGQGVNPRRAFSSMLRGDSPKFQRILQRVREDEAYRAMVITNFTVTHGPYSLEPLEAFLARFPSQLHGLTREEIARFHPLYAEHQREWQFSFPETVRRFDLSPGEVEKLVRTVDLVYRSNVWLLDTLFGEVLAEVEGAGLLDESLIVFTADHGEILFRENALFKWAHGEHLTPEVLNVPLIVRPPGGAGGRSYQGVSRSIDVYPTMAGLARVPLPPEADIDGEDLSLPLLGRSREPELQAFSHTAIPHPDTLRKDLRVYYKFFPRADPDVIWASVRDGDMVYKLRSLDGERWGYEAFDLGADRGETVNLFDPGNPRHQEMAEALDRYRERLIRRHAELEGSRTEEPALPREEQIEALRSLGYVE